MADNENKAVEEVKADVKAADTKAVEKPKKEKTPLKERIAKGWREYKSELKKIVWYNREQTFRSSVIVVVSIVVVAACIGALDYLFAHAIQWLGGLV